MMVLAVLGILAGSTWLLGFYIRKANEYLGASEEVWDRLYVAAREVISDPEMPNHLVQLTGALVLCSGCGCFATRALWDWLKMSVHAFRPRLPDKVEMLESLTPAQRDAFVRVMVTAMLYDAFQVPLRGFILRRIALPWLAAAAGHLKLRPIKRNVEVMTEAAWEVAEKKPEVRRVLALAD